MFCGAGSSVPEFTDSIVNGKSAIGPVDLFDVNGFPSKIAAQIKNYDPSTYFLRDRLKRLSRTDQFALLAAAEAVDQASIGGCYSPFDIGVSVGGGAAGMFQAEQWLKGKILERPAPPSLLRSVLPDRTSTELSKAFRFGGYQGTITTACSSSATAIGWAADLIRSGRQKAMLCGGADSLALLTFSGFNALKVVDPEPCAPFSLGRQGITLGEGAAFMLLEDADAAAARGVKIHGFVLGYSLAGEAHHMTAPEPTGESAARVMLKAIQNAGIERSDIGWINAHGTGTPLNDAVESNAVKKVFGGRALDVPLVSTKPVTGHCLGSAGAIEVAATVIALNQQIIPQTLHFRGRDPECDLDYCHDGPRKSQCKIALSNSFAFGGNITSIAVSSSSLGET